MARWTPCSSCSGALPSVSRRDRSYPRCGGVRRACVLRRVSFMLRTRHFVRGRFCLFHALHGYLFSIVLMVAEFCSLRISCGRTRSPDRVEGEPHLSAFTRALRRRVPCLPLAYTKSLVLYTLNEATSATYLYLKAGHWCYGVKGSSRLLATPFPLRFGTLVSPFRVSRHARPRALFCYGSCDKWNILKYISE